MHPKAIVTAAVLVVAITIGARAEEPDVSYDGDWSVVVQPDAAAPQTARVAIKAFSGYWQATGKRNVVAGSACVGKKLPITLQASNPVALEFTVWGSQISPSCADLTVVTKPVGDKTFEGRIESVGTIRLTRRQ